MRILCAHPLCNNRIHVPKEGPFPTYCDDHPIYEELIYRSPYQRPIYIAGPMSGYPDWNHPAFNEKARLLREAGYTVTNPAENFGGDTTLPYNIYLELALNQVMQSRAVVLLPEWGHSTGAGLEVHVAKVFGIPVYENWPEESNDISRPLR